MLSDISVVIPETIENLQLPNPSLVTFWADENERCFWIEDEITDSLFEFSKMIIRINRDDKNVKVEDRIPIKLFINSPGGDLDSTMAFLGLMELSKTPIWTVNMGVAYSAAGLILMGGHKRFAMPGSQCLIHSGSVSGVTGTFEQTQAFMTNYKKLADDVKEYILKKTNVEPKMMNKKKATDWYINTEEMIANGIVDKIVDDLDEIL